MEEKIYYENGQLGEVTIWKNGKKEGESKQYHKNGQLKEVTNYKNGKREGEDKYYFLNGEVEIFYWKNGKDITEQVLEKRELLGRIEQL
jgi:antitoxin component YwqK of YwqJK toxin-antitoxin module